MPQTPEELGEKIREAQKKQAEHAEGFKPAGKGMTSTPETARAMRAATDLVAALVVGTFLGYWLDRWLGTKPWGMLIFFFLGAVAGFVNIYRAQMGAIGKDKKE